MSRALHDLFSANGLSDLYDLFAAEEIDASMAETLTDDDLKEIGLKLGQRKRFRAVFSTGTLASPVQTQMPAERRQLTVVFCDLVGSTNLATALDPEDLREVITKYLDTTVATIRENGGYLAYTQGDGLMAYFGYPVAHEDDPIRAIRAALATVAAVQALDTIAPGKLNVRVGVATGRVVVGDMTGDSAAPRDFVVGETPNLAARMQSLAHPGEVIVAGETRHLASGTFEFDGRGTLVVKGFEEPRAVFAVKGESTGKSRFDARAVDGVQPIFGREPELDALTQLWDAAGSGKGRVCLIQGPPGIGKSRLVRGISSLAGRAAIEWQCASHLINRPLHPMVAELQREAGIQRNDPAGVRQSKAASLIARPAVLTESDLPHLASLVGAPLPEASSTDAQTRARLILDMLVRYSTRSAADGASLIVLEDAHWADPTSLEFLDLLAEKIADLPILLMVTCRPEFEPAEKLRAICEIVTLQPLGPDAGIALIENLGGASRMPAVLARRIIEKTDGVPLFVEELTKAILDALPEDGQLTTDMLVGLNIPATLQDSLMSRLDRTGPAKEIAQLGAVIGHEFTAPMVAAIAPDGADVDGAMQRLEDAGLIHYGGLMGPEHAVFNHALVQDTAYESMLRSKRQDVHVKLARAMLEGHPAFGVQEPESIARHCEYGGLTEDAIVHWNKAGQEAIERVANLAALSHLSAALRLLNTQAETPERDGTELGLQMGLMVVSMSIYGWGSPTVEVAAFRCRELARNLDHGEAIFGSTWGIWTMRFLRGELALGIEVAQEVDTMATAVGAPMLLTAADHAVAYTQYYRGEFRESYDRYELAMQRFDPAIDEEIMRNFQLASGAAIMDSGACSAWIMGLDSEADEAEKRFLAYLEHLDHSPSIAYCLGALGHFAMVRRDWTRLAEVATQNKELSADLGYLMWERVADLQLAVSTAYLNDKLAESADIVLLAQEKFLASGTRLTELLSIPPVVEMLIAAGRAEEGLELVQNRIERALQHFERLNLSDLYRARGLVFQALGDDTKARNDFETARETAKAQGAVRLVERAEAQMREIVA